MKRIALAALLSFLPIGAWAQYYTIHADADNPSQSFVIDRVFTGNTPSLELVYTDGGESVSLNDYAFVFRYFYSQFDTNGVAEIPGTVEDVNHVVFDSVTNYFFEDRTYYFSIVGTDSHMRTKTFARGTMIEEYDPGTGTNWLTLAGSISMDFYTNWIGGQVSSNTARIAVLETGKVAQVDYDAYTNSIRVEIDAHVASNVVLFAGVETQKLDVADWAVFTNTYAADSAILATQKVNAVEFSSATNAQAATNASLQAQIGSVATTLFRYAARTNAGSEVYVTANTTNVTASLSGSTLTFSIPAGTIPQSAMVRIPAGTGTTLTLAVGTNWCANTAWANSWSMTGMAFREDTGAQIPSATFKLDKDTFTQGQVIGLNNSCVTRIAINFL